MSEEKNFYSTVEEICLRDKRYKADAYEFLMKALHFTQDKLKRKGHVNAVELLEGIRQYALELYGPLARTVLGHWNVNSTEDFGNIVFNLIDKRLLSKSEDDDIKDFKEVYDFDRAFSNVFDNIVIKDD